MPEEEREACLRVISQRTQRVNELLLSFHEYSKLEHPQISVHAKRVDLCQTVREYIAGRYGEIELGGFLLEADIPEEPLDCALDPSLFYRAVENIINNAMKYNPPGTCLFVRVQRKGEAGSGAFGKIMGRAFPLSFGTSCSFHLPQGILRGAGAMAPVWDWPSAGGLQSFTGEALFFLIRPRTGWRRSLYLIFLWIRRSKSARARQGP